MALTFRSGIVRVRQAQIYCLPRLEGSALLPGTEKGQRAFGNLVLRFQLRSMSHGLFQLKDDFNGLDAIRVGAVPVSTPANLRYVRMRLQRDIIAYGHGLAFYHAVYAGRILASMHGLQSL